MTDDPWVKLSAEDIAVITDALSALGSASPDRMSAIEGLGRRLEAAFQPSITIGVYGGVVQWVQGNPYPIRIIDYDGEEDDLPDRDDEGLPCSLWHVERDPDLLSAQG